MLQDGVGDLAAAQHPGEFGDAVLPFQVRNVRRGVPVSFRFFDPEVVVGKAWRSAAGG